MHWPYQLSDDRGVSSIYFEKRSDGVYVPSYLYIIQCICPHDACGQFWVKIFKNEKMKTSWRRMFKSDVLKTRLNFITGQRSKSTPYLEDACRLYNEIVLLQWCSSMLWSQPRMFSREVLCEKFTESLTEKACCSQWKTPGMGSPLIAGPLQASFVGPADYFGNKFY